MSASPFAFFRGSARIMAYDLVSTPVSGLQTQLCGDAHLANFGSYASPERRLVFDINDFDETLLGPWEWDVKRLAASFVIAGRHNGLKAKDSRKLAWRAVGVYRAAMERLAEMRAMDVWYQLVETEEIAEHADDKKTRKEIESLVNKAKTKDSRHTLDKLAMEVDGEYRIRSEPPLLIPLRDLDEKRGSHTYRVLTQGVYEDYLKSVPDHIAHLLKKFRLVDVALKVVGVGSVGMRCFVLLLEGNHPEDPLFLQIKQAGNSVLEEHLPPSQYPVPGRRVVEGQRLLQTVSDIFLGWSDSEFSGHHFYLRQLKDWKASADVEEATYDMLHLSAATRGWTLARAHARGGDPMAISGYLGTSDAFDRAIVEFAESYADQNDADYQAFIDAIESRGLPVAELE